MMKCLSPAVNKQDMASQKIPYIHFPIVGNFVLTTNYSHLLLYISYHVSKSTIYIAGV